MSACTIYLLRHGRTAMDTLKRSDGWLDLPLSDRGRIGLIPAQQYLKLEPLKTIYAAPLRRTQETAHIVQSGVLKGPDVIPAPKAMTWDLGVLSGTRKEESRPKIKQLINAPEERPIGGETHNEFRKRFMSWFKERVREARGDGKPLLIVCSGSNLRLLGTELFDDQDAFNLDEGGLVCLNNVDGQWHKEVIFGDPEGGGLQS